MKPSSGRARSAATLAATAFGGVAHGMSRGVALDATRALALRVTVAVALAAVPAAAAFAQKTATLPQGPAVRDNTPEIDTSIAQKNWAAALTQLDARIASNPRDAQAKFKRGTVLAHLGRDDEAITAFTELTQTYPELPEPYNNLAALYAKQGRYAEARAALETATKVNPGYGLAYENLGDLYLHMADQAYRRAQSLGKASATTTQRLADIQKVISPAKGRTQAPARPAAATEDDYTTRATSNMTQTPSFQYGGANGSLAMPPYMAPSK
ncbi:tetratricopeptide repeat family protein [Paraburkholderia xenovorans LB400]|uniref:tetratricopeptide repeat protein n=1 Tax=Paraburkholderia xenovorans TaxID=36873 RepID=UPI00003C3E96|nr:tetratricopeptide repeat protein [Paraburkholderia xenovorans]AIP30515.1 tetratricopeptide repeat family protein [Paraburkholderia xenovorans LB400]